MWWHADIDEGIRRQTVRALLAKVLPLFRGHMRLLLLGFLLLIPVTGAMLAPPLILGNIINQVMTTGDVPNLYLWVGAFFVIIVGGAGLAYWQAITLFRLGIRIITELKARLFEHVLHLGLDFHEKHPPGKLLSRIESDAESFRELFGDVAVNLLRNVLYFLGILGILFYMHPEIAVWIVGLVPILFTAVFLFLTFMRRFYMAFRARWAIVSGYVAEYVQGIDVIQQFNYQSNARERMNEVNLGKFRVEVPMFFFEYTFWGAFLYSEIIAIVIIITMGIKGFIAGTILIGDLVIFIEYIRQMFFPMMQLSEQLNFAQRALVSVERVTTILETERSVKDGPAQPWELTFDHEIEFQNVWFAYEGENWILRDVSFKVEKGKKIALVGSSGGGKSTVVNLLLRFYDPQEGKILVDGRDLSDFPVDAWRSYIGLVLQDIFLFPGSVANNIRIFDESIGMDRVKEVCEIAHADKLIEKIPGKYDGELAERGANLSVGERQLLSFARALIKDPPLLVLDEATSSVDPHTERLVQEALDRLLSGRTAVIVAHRLSTILNADRILLITGGKVQESGTHEELLAADGKYAKLFRLQFDYDYETNGTGGDGI